MVKVSSSKTEKIINHDKKEKNMQNDMRKGGTARTDETRPLCLFNKVGFTKQKREEVYRL